MLTTNTGASADVFLCPLLCYTESISENGGVPVHFVQAKHILSPSGGMNLYRGCTHGCIYCDARSDCYHMDHAFEDVAVKENALTLLETTLARKRRKTMLGLGAMSDPYQPLEERLGYTRQALQLATRYGFGFTLITKSARVLRDLDLLERLHHETKCVVQMTLTTFDDTLCCQIEPNVSLTSERIAALKTLQQVGIPTVVWLSPFLPFLNDTEKNLHALLDACADCGVTGILCFGIGLTLRAGNREYFYTQLDRRFPGLKEQYQRRYGEAYVVTSPHNDCLMAHFHQTCAKRHILHDNTAIFRYLHDYTPTEKQQRLF